MCHGLWHSQIFFASHVGVRQGENLSPLLFALFLNVLDTFFTKQKWDTLDYIDKLYSDCNNSVSRMLNLSLHGLKLYIPCKYGMSTSIYIIQILCVCVCVCVCACVRACVRVCEV